MGLALNTLTANYEYSRSNRENYRHQVKCNYLKKHKSFAAFFLQFWNLHFQCFEKKKKNEPHRSSISGVIASERCAYLNA